MKKKRRIKKRIKRKIIISIALAILITTLFNIGINLKNDEDKKLAKPREELELTNKGKVVSHPTIKLNYYINKYLEEKQINKNKIAIYVKNFETGETYSLNPNKDFIAASTYKLPLAMYYYEKIYYGDMSLNSWISSAERDYEPGGATYNLPVGNSLDIATLLHRAVRDSDNTASKMLYRNLGGWYSYKSKIKKYSNHSLNSSFDTVSNVQTVQYLSDCLEYIYNHQNMYATLIDDMYDAEPSNYLNYKINGITAQKYGLYSYALNSAGIVFEGSPYSIVILTELGGYGENVIGEINRICYEYFNSSKQWKVLVNQD